MKPPGSIPDKEDFRTASPQSLFPCSFLICSSHNQCFLKFLLQLTPISLMFKRNFFLVSSQIHFDIFIFTLILFQNRMKYQFFYSQKVMLFYIKDTCLKHPPKFFQKNESLNFGTRYSLLILDRQNCNADYLFLILLCPLKKLLILKYFLLNYFTILNFYLSPVLHFIE